MPQTAFQIDGMSCAGCARRARETLLALDGVADAEVNFATRQATVTGVSAARLLPAAAEALRAAGFRLVPSEAPPEPWWGGEMPRVFASGALILGGWLVEPHGAHHGYDGLASPREWVSLAAIAAGGLLAAIPVALNAFRALARRELTADVLVSLAVIAAASIGQFLPAAEVAFILLLGERLEELTLRRARRAVGDLVRLTPRTARLVEGGAEREIPAADVKPGDRLRVLPGELIPADGAIESGASSVVQAAITGESLPVDKGPGDGVFAGTVNGEGALLVRAAVAGADSALGRIQELVEKAQQHHAPIQRVCDRYAAFVIPLMLALAAATLIALRFGFQESWSAALYRAVTVMIVACPCALVLATPTAVVAALGRAARAGVLFKTGAAIEAAGRVTAVVFDKTGTLTRGAFSVAALHPVGGATPEELLAHAAIAERHSEHPIAAAVLDAARERGLDAPEPESFRAEPGMGAVAVWRGAVLRAGRAGWLAKLGVPGAERAPEAPSATLLGVARDGVLLGWITVSDSVRPHAADAVGQLRALSVGRVMMLTGDHAAAAGPVARAAGIAEGDVIAEVLPGGKAEEIRGLQASGAVVAMVGDGINDAPALATADAGIALGASGAALALEAAPIALITEDLRRVPFAIRIGRSMLDIVRQGLIFSLVFNITMISTAMHGSLPMWLAAVAHQGSSILVILNALRLLRVRL